MRIISRLLIPAILVSFFATLPMIVHSKEREIVRIPQKSNLSCDGAIEAVKQDLKGRGYFSEGKVGERIIRSKFTQDSEHISTYYFNYPKNRTTRIVFSLSPRSGRSPEMVAPIPIASLSAKIMSACDRVGIVDFSHWEVGSMPVGFFPNRTARAFEWVDLFGAHQRSVRLPGGSRQNLFEWGYFYSS